MQTPTSGFLRALTWFLAGVALGVGTGLPMLIVLGQKVASAIVGQEIGSLVVREVFVRSGMVG